MSTGQVLMNGHRERDETPLLSWWSSPAATMMMMTTVADVFGQRKQNCHGPTLVRRALLLQLPLLLLSSSESSPVTTKSDEGSFPTLLLVYTTG